MRFYINLTTIRNVKSMAPFLFIFLTWCIFAFPFFFQNKVPYPSNYQVNAFPPWSAYSEFAGPVKNGAMPDVITQIFPWRFFTIEQWKNGMIALWNPYSFAGTPHLANYQSAVLSPFNVLFFIFPFVDAWSILVLLQPLLAGIFMYMFVRSVKRRVIAGVIASVSFMFCGFITVWMDYGTLGYAILFLPLSLFCIEKYVEKRDYKYLWLLSFTIPLSFFSGHFQTSIYFIIAIFAYIFFHSFFARSLKMSVSLCLYVGFGLLFSMPQILPSVEFYLHSVRSEIFQKGEIIPWGYIYTLIAPDFYGNPVTRNDWFGHYAEWNGYAGAVPLMLAIYSFFKINYNKINKHALFFVCLAIISLLLAYDTLLFQLLVNFKIPVLSTSAASRIIVLFSFSIAVLSAFGYDRLAEDIKNKNMKSVILWTGICLFMISILWIVIVFKIIPDPSKVSVAKSNLILPTIIFLSGIGIIISKIFIKNRKLLLILSFTLVILVVFDMLRFVTKWQPFDPKKYVFPNTGVGEFYSQIPSYYRFLGNYGAEMSVIYKLPSLEGYDPVYIKKYGELARFIEDGKLKNAERSVVSFPKNGKYTSQAIKLLGVKYIIHKVSDDRAVWTFPYWNYPENLFKVIFDDGRYRIYENKEVGPRAFLVGDYKIEKKPERILNLLFDKEFDFEREAIIEEDIRLPRNESITSKVSITDYAPNEIRIKTDSRSDGLLVLTDNYYPGWKAYVDGVEGKIYRANYTFRANIVPKGIHEVVYRYEPKSFEYGVYSAIIGLIALVSLLILAKKCNHNMNKQINQ